ncbi:MAG: hypothetical protein NTW28_13465 [Candidatus Solibacter sp.]|nr:hypothetical protein [Candidatus Solibacter sp.]
MATYTEIGTLYRGNAFLLKVEVAVLKYLEYILSEENHTKRWNWAVQAAQSGPSTLAARIAPNVAWDTVIQAHLGASTDAEVQAAVESWINRLLQF